MTAGGNAGVDVAIPISAAAALQADTTTAEGGGGGGLGGEAATAKDGATTPQKAQEKAPKVKEKALKLKHEGGGGEPEGYTVKFAKRDEIDPKGGFSLIIFNFGHVGNSNYLNFGAGSHLGMRTLKMGQRRGKILIQLAQGTAKTHVLSAYVPKAATALSVSDQEYFNAVMIMKEVWQHTIAASVNYETEFVCAAPRLFSEQLGTYLLEFFDKYMTPDLPEALGPLNLLLLPLFFALWTVFAILAVIARSLVLIGELLSMNCCRVMKQRKEFYKEKSAAMPELLPEARIQELLKQLQDACDKMKASKSGIGGKMDIKVVHGSGEWFEENGGPGSDDSRFCPYVYWGLAFTTPRFSV